MENMNECPGCPRHCDRNNLQCERGEAYFNAEATPDSFRAPAHHERGSHSHPEGRHPGHGHRRPEFPAGSLADLMAQCARRLFHGDEAVFAVLTQEETATLKGLLEKLAAKG